MIQKLRIEQRENLAVIEKLKRTLMSRGMSIAQVQQVMDEVLNEPKRVRPRTIESYQVQVAELEAKNDALERDLHRAIDKNRTHLDAQAQVARHVLTCML